MKSLLVFREVELSFPGVPMPVLSQINCTVSAGEFVIVLGSNGSGKSSLLKLIDSSYTAEQGKILLHNKNIKHYNPQLLAKKVARLTQNYNQSVFSSLTVLENCLLVYGSRNSKERLAVSGGRNIKEFFLEYLCAFNANLPSKFNRLTAELSGGEKQALALALKVLYPPEVLLLDEHTSALDPVAANKLMEITDNIIKEFKLTCLLTTHDLDIALKYGQRVIALQHGKILCEYTGQEKYNLSTQELLVACY